MADEEMREEKSTDRTTRARGVSTTNKKNQQKKTQQATITSETTHKQHRQTQTHRNRPGLTITHKQHTTPTQPQKNPHCPKQTSSLSRPTI